MDNVPASMDNNVVSMQQIAFYKDISRSFETEINGVKYTVIFDISDPTFSDIKIVDGDGKYVNKPEIFSKVLSRYFSDVNEKLCIAGVYDSIQRTKGIELVECCKPLISEYKSLATRAVELGYEDSSEDVKDAEFKVGNGDLTNFSLLNVTVPQFSEIKQNSYSDRCAECQGSYGICHETEIVTKTQLFEGDGFEEGGSSESRRIYVFHEVPEPITTSKNAGKQKSILVNLMRMVASICTRYVSIMKGVESIDESNKILYETLDYLNALVENKREQVGLQTEQNDVRDERRRIDEERRQLDEKRRQLEEELAKLNSYDNKLVENDDVLMNKDNELTSKLDVLRSNIKAR